MNTLTIECGYQAILNWEYDLGSSGFAALYEKAKQNQWNAATTIDWSLPVDFGGRLSDQSAFAMASFAASPLARGGRPLWERFCWEQQTWMVAQFLHGEQGALAATARLAEVLPSVWGKLFAASQVMDEARHVEVFSRYIREHVPNPYPISQPLATLLEETLRAREWDITALGMQVIVEPLAMGAFRTANTTLHDPLIRQITKHVARDEARHIAFGVLMLEGYFNNLTASERREREQFVVAAAELMVRRMVLEDVWERVGVSKSEGIHFASTNEMMLMYRQTVFSRVVTILERIGLMTPSVARAFDRLGIQRRASSSADTAVR